MADIVVRKTKKASGTTVPTAAPAAPVVTLKSSTPGPQGPPGEQGPVGMPGPRGLDGGPAFMFNSVTTDADPGYGKFSFNSATIGSVTYIYVDDQDAFINDMETWIQTWDDCTASVRGYLTFKRNGTGQLAIFSVTGAVVDGTGYWKIPVQYVAGTLFAEMDLCMVGFARTGESGQTLAFQAAEPDSTGDYEIDATTYKDWVIDELTGSATINLNNTSDGDAGMLEIVIDSTGGYTITLGTMFTKQMGPLLLDNSAGADNIISWRKVGASNIVYTIAQIEV